MSQCFHTCPGAQTYTVTQDSLACPDNLASQGQCQIDMTVP